MVWFASVGLFVSGAVALAVPRIVLPSAPWQNRVLSVVADAKCGPIGATINSTKTTGPNGAQHWLGCGLNSTTGWSPPEFTVQDVITKDLETAVAMPNSPFVRCQPYFPYFYKYGEMYNIPPIIIASFANQESGCNPGTIGGGDEQGMMQITPDKCGGAPNGNCLDVDYNIHTAVAYFADQLKANNNSIVTTIGAYNGWFAGMTVQAATAAASTPCCRCQQNLDYIHQMCNGWLQGVDPYATGMGSYFNLAVCDNQPTSSSAAPVPASTPAPVSSPAPASSPALTPIPMPTPTPTLTPIPTSTPMPSPAP